MKVKLTSSNGESFLLALEEGKNVFKELPGLVVTRDQNKILASFNNSQNSLTYKDKKIPLKRIFHWKLGQILHLSSIGEISLEIDLPDSRSSIDFPNLNHISQTITPAPLKVPSSENSKPKSDPSQAPKTRVHLSELAHNVDKKLKKNLFELQKLRRKYYLVIGLNVLTFIIINCVSLINSFERATPLETGTSRIEGNFRLKKDKSKSFFDFKTRNGLVALVFLPFLLGTRFKYRHEFKSSIVEKVFKSIDSNWTYSYYSSVEENKVRSSLLFDDYNTFRGDDLVTGEINKIPFEMSEIRLTKVNKSRKRKSNYIESKIFHGLFLTTQFNKKINGKTLVFPDIAQRNFGTYLGNIFQKLNSKVSPHLGDLVQLEDPRFEKLFSVYSTNQIEARYILDAKNMESFLALHQRLRRTPFRASFIGNNLCVAIEYNRPLFEPPMFGEIISKHRILEILELFQVSQHIMSEINSRTPLELTQKKKNAA